MSTDLFVKRRDREATPDFANINLLGSCNARCYFCLGRDLGELIANRHDDRIHFESWPRFKEFLDQLHAANVSKVYVTGQNTDALLYRFLPFLVYHLHREGFQVGLRTNGLLAPFNYYSINQCELSTGYSIQSLNPETLHQIMGWTRVPDWDTILRQTARPRVSMVVGRYNWQEFWDVLNLVKRHKHVRYFQARRISTDTRQKELLPDLVAYESLHDTIAAHYPVKQEFHGAPIYDIDGVDVVFWRTVQTTVSSMNYFTDGTISDCYFIVEGYLKNREFA